MTAVGIVGHLFNLHEKKKKKSLTARTGFFPKMICNTKLSGTPFPSVMPVQ